MESKASKYSHREGEKAGVRYKDPKSRIHNWMENGKHFVLRFHDILIVDK